MEGMILREEIRRYSVRCAIMNVVPESFRITRQQAVELAKEYVDSTGIVGSDLGDPKFYLNGGPLYGVRLAVVNLGPKGHEEDMGR